MDGSRDLNISGFKIVNVAEPTEQGDVGTKGYIDKVVDEFSRRIIKYINDLRNYTPNFNVEEYIRYINLREITCHSLAGLVTMKSTIPCVPHITSQHGIPHVWIESPTCTTEYKIENLHNIVGSNIQASFQFPIKVKIWIFHIIQDDKDIPWKLSYQWECSNDGKIWTVISSENKAMSVPNIWSGNNSEIVFVNEKNSSYLHWRVVFKHSQTTAKIVYINYLKMRVEKGVFTENNLVAV